MTIDDTDHPPSVPFGRPMRDAHFLFAPEYTPLNHGSFGTYPKAVQKCFHGFQSRSEARPDAYVRYYVPKKLDDSRAAIASYLNVPVDEVVLVPNASTATNVVLRSLRFDERDILLHFSTVYGAVEKTLEYLREVTPLEGVPIPLQYPMSDEDIIQALVKGIHEARSRGKRVRGALLDTVSSLPGVRIPWERCVEVCKSEGILSIVDGAHGVGHIPINLQEAQPDFFVSNLHKWLFVPRPCAVFYVPERNQHLIRTSLPTSHGFKPRPRENGHSIESPLPTGSKSDFVQLFEFVATLDTSAYFCIEEALRFRKEVCGGEKNVMEHCRSNSDEGGKVAAKILGTEVMENEEGSLGQCAFSNVRLPLKEGDNLGEIPKDHAKKAIDWIAQRLVDDYDVYVAIYCHADTFWARFSGQVYLDITDFVKGAEALKALCENVIAGECYLGGWSQG